jgi:glycosyltransferase involved in cell wall biosynthesis
VAETLRAIFNRKTPRVLSPGLNLIGSFTAEIGLGQAARNLSYALDSQRIPFCLVDMTVFDRMNELEFYSKVQLTNARRVNLVVSALTVLPASEAFRSGRLNVLYPFWELRGLPKSVPSELAYYDEVWAPSRFIMSMLKPLMQSRVSYVPQPLQISAVASGINKSGGPFSVLTFFDLDSYAARKNPEASVKAFLAAFGPKDTNAMLTVKVRGIGSHSHTRSWLQEQAANNSNITLIDETLTREGLHQLVCKCDCFISMHRSEGFGFGPAEALAEGKAVVSTDYSATMDFISTETGFPVKYKMINLGPNDYIHWENQQWADPDVEHAAHQLRYIRDNLDIARAKANKGRQLLIDKFSPEAVGALIAQKIAAYL